MRTFAFASASMLVAELAVAVVACGGQSNGVALSPSPVSGTGQALFAEDFESGTLAAWQDGVDATRHRVVTDPIAQSGSRYLAVTHPAGRDGGWLTRFLMPGYESLYVSYHVRFPSSWRGGTKLVALYGSRTDNQWSAFGQAGRCPTGSDFFAAMLVTEPNGDPGPVRFYTYHPAMNREPDGVTCWGRYGDGSESYMGPLTLSRDQWHRVELFVQLNSPGQKDARQAFWLDGVQRGTWSGLSFGDSTMLRLNAVQLTFSVSGGVPHSQDVYIDNLVVRTAPP